MFTGSTSRIAAATERAGSVLRTPAPGRSWRTTGRVYVKRQRAFFCRPAWNAFRRTPTLRREARFISQARALGVNVPDVVLYQEGSDDRALLVLREIDGAVDLEKSLLSLDARERRELFENIGKMLAKLHSARLLHGAVYPKHVLVEVGSPPRLADRSGENATRTVPIFSGDARHCAPRPARTVHDGRRSRSAGERIRRSCVSAPAGAVEALTVLNRTSDRRPVVLRRRVAASTAGA